MSTPRPVPALGRRGLTGTLDLCRSARPEGGMPARRRHGGAQERGLPAYHDSTASPSAPGHFGSIRTAEPAAARPQFRCPTCRRMPARPALLERLLGLSAARPMPRFQRQDLLRWYRRAPPGDPGHPQRSGEAVFLADCFTTFTEPAGRRSPPSNCWNGRLARSGSWHAACCGRASLSKGLVDQRPAAWPRGLADPAVRRGVPPVACPIVAAEPSCLLTLRDELPRPAGRATRERAGRRLRHPATRGHDRAAMLQVQLPAGAAEQAKRRDRQAEALRQKLARIETAAASATDRSKVFDERRSRLIDLATVPGRPGSGIRPPRPAR